MALLSKVYRLSHFRWRIWFKLLLWLKTISMHKLGITLLFSCILMTLSGQEELLIPHPDGHSLAGTLVLPSGTGPFKCVILISGSGPQNRDEELLGHKPFQVISDHLSKTGTAVFRFDDRGIAKSTGDHDKATSADFASDVVAIYDYLSKDKRINSSQIGLAGHSEGGMIAAMAAVKRPTVAFVISLAGTGVSGKDVLFLQNFLIAKKMGLNDEQAKTQQDNVMRFINIIESESDTSVAKQKIATAFDEQYAAQKEFIPNYDEMRKAQIASMGSPWMRFFVTYNPSDDWKKVKCPVLILNGADDIQVIADQNMSDISAALESGGNSNYQMVLFPKMNHLFQYCETCSLQEYSTIQGCFELDVLTEMEEWLRKTIR
jgi:pimeloyl-ACP methyl ester carboxylesterase